MVGMVAMMLPLLLLCVWCTSMGLYEQMSAACCFSLVPWGLNIQNCCFRSCYYHECNLAYSEHGLPSGEKERLKRTSNNNSNSNSNSNPERPTPTQQQVNQATTLTIATHTNKEITKIHADVKENINKSRASRPSTIQVLHQKK